MVGHYYAHPLSSTTRRYRRFIRGPIPEGWMQRASAISPTAGLVGLILWSVAYENKLFGLSGRKYRSEPIKITNQMCDKYGISKQAKMVALKKMADAGLIRLRKPQGSSPRALIIDPELL